MAKERNLEQVIKRLRESLDEEHEQDLKRKKSKRENDMPLSPRDEKLFELKQFLFFTCLSYFPHPHIYAPMNETGMKTWQRVLNGVSIPDNPKTLNLMELLTPYLPLRETYVSCFKS